MTRRLWLVPVAGALLAPLLTWTPLLAWRFPWLHLPRYSMADGFSIDWMHMQVFWFLVFAVVGLLIGRTDRWLGVALAAYGAELLLFAGVLYGFHHFVFLGGALLLWAVRQLPATRKPLVVAILAASGCFQAVYMLQQWVGYDLLWSPIWWGILVPANPEYRMVGTFGTVDAASAYIAVTAPLMPFWCLPLAIAAVVLGHSIGACIALVVGLLIAYHRDWRLTGAFAGVALMVGAWAFVVKQQWHVPSTITGRVEIWSLALRDLWHAKPVPAQLGFYDYANPVTGNGTWFPRVAILQKLYHVDPTGESFAQAHNEYLQWIYTRGLVGAGLLAAWLLEHRRMFRDPAVGASLCALAVVSGSFFTFQVVSVALLGICLLGVATPTQEIASC